MREQREIKFRCWDSISKELHKWETINYLPLPDFLKFEHYTLIQYTGLKDKNGKEIYESDILYCLKCYYRLERHNNGCYELYEIGTEKMFILENELHTVEIIGNIYENPELLESKKTD